MTLLFFLVIALFIVFLLTKGGPRDNKANREAQQIMNNETEYLVNVLSRDTNINEKLRSKLCKIMEENKKLEILIEDALIDNSNFRMRAKNLNFPPDVMPLFDSNILFEKIVGVNSSYKINKGVESKKNGDYFKANNIYSEIKIQDGNTIRLNVAIAKNLICNMEYTAAIAILSKILGYIENLPLSVLPESTFEVTQNEKRALEGLLIFLLNRKGWEKETALVFLKQTAGNENYTFPYPELWPIGI